MRPGELAGAISTELIAWNDAQTGSELSEKTSEKVVDLAGTAAKIETNLGKAKTVGVDAARKSFWNKVLGVTVAALALAVVTSLSVATGGAPLLAAVAVAGVIFAVSVADVCVSRMNLRNAEAFAQGQPLPHHLPMGDSAIGNAIYLMCPKSWSHGTCKNVARAADNGIRLGLTLAAGFCTAGATVLANSFEHVAPLVAGAINVISLLVNIRSSWASNSRYEQHVQNINDEYEHLRYVVNKNLPASDRPAFIELINTSQTDALREVTSMRGAVPSRAAMLPTSIGGIGWIVTGALAALMPGSSLAGIRLLGGAQTFTSPVIRNLGAVGTAKLGPASDAPARDDSPSINAVGVHLSQKIASGEPMRYEETMVAARGIVTEMYDAPPSVEYLHFVLKGAVAQLKAPSGAAEQLKNEIREHEVMHGRPKAAGFAPTAEPEDKPSMEQLYLAQSRISVSIALVPEIADLPAVAPTETRARSTAVVDKPASD